METYWHLARSRTQHAARSTEHGSLQTYPVTRFQLNPGVAHRSARAAMASLHHTGKVAGVPFSSSAAQRSAAQRSSRGRRTASWPDDASVGVGV